MLWENHDTRSRPLDIPLERRCQILAPIIDVRDGIAFRHGESAKTQQMRVAVRLRADVDGRRSLQTATTNSHVAPG